MLLLSATNSFLKMILEPRPYWLTDKIKAGAFHDSFRLPSGHSQIPQLFGAGPRTTKPSQPVLSVMILLIGLSRIFLGVHFISDVLLGWTIGRFGFDLCPLLETNRSKPARYPPKQALFALSALLMILFPPGEIAFQRLAGAHEWLLAGEIDPMNLNGA